MKIKKNKLDMGQTMKLLICITICAASISSCFLIISIINILNLDPINFGAMVVGMKNHMVFKLNEHDLTDKAIVSCADNFQTDLSRAKCVNAFFSTLYKYSLNVANSADEVLINGSDCKGSAGWYDYAFTRLGITHWYSTEPDHVYIKAQIESRNRSIICNLDEGSMFCTYRGEAIGIEEY